MAAIILVMTVEWNGSEVTLRRATGECMNDVLAVLDEAAGWLNTRGISQWPSRFEAAWVEEAISRGETWLVCVDTAQQCGVDALRLDCVKENGQLRAYYEAQGFMHRGDMPVGGAPGQRDDDGPVTWVSRYELALSEG